MAEVKKPTKKQKKGRPTEYKPEFCDMMRKFFLSPKQKIVHDCEYFQNGQLKRKKPVVLPPQYPTIERFAHSVLGVAVSTVYKWEKTYPKFREACEYARDEQKAHLLTLGLSKDFDPGFAKFLLSVRYPDEYRETQEMTHSGGLDIRVNYGKTAEEKKA